ncbi:MAG: hypothetical protein QM811_21170 [Pirellulales bacterium]
MRAPLSIQARPISCVFGLSLIFCSSSSPIGPSITCAHVRDIAEHERQVEHVKIVDDRSDRAGR